MLRIYICPKCFNFRMVSRRKDAICFHCGATLMKCELDYSTYMNMTEEDRTELKNNYKKELSSQNTINSIDQEQNTCE